MENHGGVVVNLGAVTFIDSSGLGFLVRLAATTRHSPSGLRFCGANEQMAKVLELTKLKNILHIHATEAEAINAFSTKASAPALSGLGANVLCLDESMDLLAFLRESLDKAGFQTHSARTVPDAILLLRTIRPAVVVAGPQFASKVSALAAGLKIPLLCLDQEFSTLDAGDAIGGLLEQLRGALERGSA
jgi:hypothetical protein